MRVKRLLTDNRTHCGHRRCLGHLTGLLLSLTSQLIFAAPQGGQIVAGSGNITTPDAQTTVVTQQSQSLSVNWQSLNLSADELLQFNQPNSQSAALNYILDQHPSEILGRINANGRVFLMNPNGIVFGQSARINVGGLVAGTLQTDFASLKDDGGFSFTSGDGTIENQGEINAAEGGSVALVGKHINNTGQINARLGKIHLLSADSATLSFDPDGLIQFSVEKGTLENVLGEKTAIQNAGTLQADGGYVVLEANAANNIYQNVINNEGLIQANRIHTEGGVIRLEGSGGNVITSGDIKAIGLQNSSGGEVAVLGDRVGVFGDATIDVSGDSGGGRIAIGGYAKGSGEHRATFTQLSSNTTLRADAINSGQGGDIVAWADDTTWAMGKLSATGGSHSGDGGFIEISGKQGLVMSANVDLTADQGTFGTLLLDPTDITIHDAADGAQGNDGMLPDLSDATRGAGTFDIGETALEGLAGTSILQLEASNNIVMNDLVDNVLALNINSGGSITITADSDNNGSGSFSMNAGDTISTQGGALSISGAGVTLGTLNTNGALDGSITVNSTASASIASANSGTQPISIAIDTDANGTESLTVAGSLSGSSVSLQGGTNGGDTLIGPNLANAWTVTALDTGTLNGASFLYFQNLTGGSADDTFTVSGTGSITGIIDGGADTTGDTVDYSGATGLIAVTLNTDVTNIESLIGGGADYTLVAEDIANTWTLTAQNDGSVAGVSFTDFSNLIGGTNSDDFILSGGSTTGTINGGAGSDSLTANNTANSWNILSANGGNVNSVFAFINIENLNGGNGADTFLLNSGSVSGAINGGAGSDSLAPDNVPNTWDITGNDAGTVTGVGSFSNIENLNGRNNTDDFSIADGVSISGTIDGGGGNDTIDLSTQSGLVIVNLAGTSYANIEQYTGNGASSTLIGPNVANVWAINGFSDGVNDGTVGLVSFIDFANIMGGSDTDSFSFSSGTLTGSLNGGAGSDTLIADNVANTWNITAADAGDATGIGAFSSIENLTGNANSDNFIFGASGSLSGVVNGASGADTVDYSAVGGAVSVTLGSAGFANIEAFIGNDTDSTIIGDNIINAWTITGVNDGTINTTTFTNFNNITGGSNADTITLQGGSISGQLDGGLGTDTLVADNIANTWNITGADSGLLSGVAGFSNIENLTGNATTDNFVFAVGGSLSGIINGAAGADTIDYSAKVGAVNVDLSSTNFNSIENFIGNDTSSTFYGDNVANTWNINGNNDGTIGIITFTDFNNLVGNDSTDDFVLSAGGAITGSITGGLGSDSIQGLDTGDSWNITGVDVGNLSTVSGFSGIETLKGGNGIDTFTFANGSTFSGLINGGAGSDVVNLSAELGAINVNLSASSFLNIESFVGNGSNSTLTGANTSNSWIIDGADSGTVNTVAFSGFNNLVGNNQVDQFFVSGGTISGSISGGSGSDILTADDVVNTWNISAVDQGSVTGINAFTQIENINGGNQLDAFVFANGASMSGSVDGRTGSDSADFSANAGSVTIALGVSGYNNIETFIGNNIDSTLIGPVASTSWLITGNNDGVVGTTNFTNFNNLTGNVSSDTFQFQNGSTITGVIDGGAGLDTVNFSLESGSVNVAIGSLGFSNIETFIGNGTSSTLTGDNLANTWSMTSTNAGTISNTGGSIDFSGFNNLLGNANTDDFVLNSGNITGSIDGGNGMDSITADNAANTWIITSANAGSVTGVSGFSNIENLIGNTANDSFIFADGGSITGAVNGGGGTGIDSVNESAQSGVVNITLGASNFTNIESFIGNGSNSTLIGENIVNAWSITGLDAGTVGLVGFSNFSNLQGGSNDDTFAINGGTLTGQINGGAGNDLLQADNMANTWNLTGVDIGDVNGINSFANIETLSGNASADNFIFANGSSYSGVIDGTGGVDSVNYSSETGAVLVSLASGQYQNIETFVGNTTNSNLVAGNLVNAWSITGNNSGTVNGINFNGFNNITGNTSSDTFTLNAGSITGTIDGGTGNDSIQADNITNTWNVTSPDSGNLTNVNAFQNIDNLLGGNTVDTFNINANVSGNVDGAGGDDFINLGGLITVGGSLIGGAGNDVLTGPSQNSSWTLSGIDSGLVNAIAFSQIETLNGGIGNDSFTITNGAAAANSGGINGGAGNDDLLVDYIAASTRTIAYNGGSGTDSIVLTGSGTGLTNSYVFGPASGQVDITTTSVSNSQVINGAGVESVADALTADSISLTGSSLDDVMVLSPGIISGLQPVSFQISGMPSLQFSNKTNLDLNAGLGNDSLRIDGTVSLPGNVTIDAETITEGTAGVLGADLLSFDQAATIGASGAALATNVNTLQINGPTVDAYIAESNGLAVAVSGVSGVLDISTSTGDITSSGSVVVTGTSSFAVGNDGSIILDNPANQFAGTPAFSSTGTIADLTLIDNSSVDLPSLNLNGNLIVTASGAVGQVGAITVQGTSNINAGSNSITLNNGANNFVGAVTLQNSGTASTTITDASSLLLAGSNVGSGTLSVNAADISQSGPIVQSTNAGAATFTATGGDIALTNGANDFTGTVYLVNSGAGNTYLTESNGLSLGSSATNGGDLTITASNGITLSGTTTSSDGDITLTASTGDIQLGRVDSGAGRLTVNAVTGNIVGNNSPITDPNLSSQTLEMIAGQTIGDFNNPISIRVPAGGTSFFSTGIGSANIIGLTGTVLGGSVLVNDVAATNSAVGKGQSVSFLEQNLTPLQGHMLEPLYSISGGGLHLLEFERTYDWDYQPNGSKRKKGTPP